METGVQRKYAPHSICFGCGPANEKGLQIDSHVHENGLKAVFNPQSHHQAFPGMLCGGIIGTLLDCHGNWTAAIALMKQANQSEPPCTVTASYSIKLRRPTPINNPLDITSKVMELLDDRVKVEIQLHDGDRLCASGEGLFVAVKEGHPAYHRWS